MKKFFSLAIALVAALAANAQFDYTETEIYTVKLDEVFTNMVNCSCNQTAAPGEGQVTGKNEIKLTTGGTEASFNMGAAVKWTYTNSQDGAVIAKQYGKYVQPNGKDRVITITAAAGAKVTINVVEAISKDGVTITGISEAWNGFEAGANEFTATGNVVITTAAEKPKFSAILVEGGTAVENVEAAVKAQKVIENGQLIIIKNGVRYNALGAVVE